MEFLNAVKFLTVLMFLHVTDGQSLSLTGPSLVSQGNNTVFRCTVTGGTTAQLQWVDSSVNPAQTIYSDGGRFSQDTKYTNFQLTETTTTSVMTIENTHVTDEGNYGCTTPVAASSTTDLVVEVESARSLTLSSTVTNTFEDFYEATCEATGGKPMETITWILDGETQSDGNGNTIDTTNPPATSPLSNTRSIFTFPATPLNYEQTLMCEITGHTLTALNGQESIELNIHTSPSNASTTVTVDYVTQGTSSIIVSCDAANEPNPIMRNYYIYSNGSLIYESADGTNEYTVTDPEAGTQYTCLAGNYLGNTPLSEAVTYDPTSPTTPSPTTESSSTEGPSPSPTDDEGGGGVSPAAIGGGVAGAIVVIIIVIVIIYCVKREKSGFSLQGLFTSCNCCLRCCNCCLPSNPPPRKNQSAVGTSNGSEKNDVELAAPLNHGVNEVLTEDKIKPVAAPRDQGSIQHTTDNPGQAEYAMVDRKKPGGGDMPDTRGSGQKEPPQGMLYADLDLSASAGHTEKKVPQNKDDVVVYSSILV